jgi:hypothetical protein
MNETIAVALPFQLVENELVLDPAAIDNRSLAGCLDWLLHEAHSAAVRDGNTIRFEAEAERILRSAVCLKTALPEASLAECLNTAIIWERG